jgi:chromosome partitioning protein
MPLVISVLSQKGGVGKSTLSRLIATSYATGGWNVKIADFNTKQKTSVDWVAMRMEAGVEPPIAAEPFTSVRNALKSDVHLIVIDGRPDSDTTSLEAARASQIVVIPTGESLDDLKPQVLFAHELVGRGVSRSDIIFVLNNTTTPTSIRDARDYVRLAGYSVAENDLPARAGFRMAQNTGRAVSETLYPQLNERAVALANEIVEKMSSKTPVNA